MAKNNPYALNFNGPYIVINNPLVMGEDFSISFWTKLYSTGTNCFFCTREALGYGVSVFALNNNEIRIDTDVANHWESKIRVPVNTYIHITITKNSDSISLYFDGELQGSTTSVGTMSRMSSYATLGASNINMGTIDNKLDGVMDNISIWNKALTQEEIQFYMNRKKRCA